MLATAAAFAAVARAPRDGRAAGGAALRPRRGGGGELFQSSGAFWYQRGSTLFSVEAADRDAQTLTGVAIYERDRERPAPAQRGGRHRPTSRPTPLAPRERALPRVPARRPGGRAAHRDARSAVFELGSAGDLALLDADPRSLSLLRLREYIRALEHEGRDTTRYRSLLHARLVDPLTVLLFAVLGTPLGVGVERSRSLAVAALQGIALLGGYYALQTTASVVGSGGVAGRRARAVGRARSVRRVRGVALRAHERLTLARAHSVRPSRYWKNSVSGDSTSVVLPSIVLR